MARKKSELDVVAAVQAQTAQAAALAEITGQHLLNDPRLNPGTRQHADRLRTDELVKSLNAQHSRALRRHRVADARAAEAERTLEAIAIARRTSSPARSVLALHRGRRMWSRLSLGASVALAAGSAMGVEATAEWLDAPTGTGYLAEIGLTGLSTAAIAYRSHLAEHRGEITPKSWQARVLWALMTVPLAVSVAANVTRLNALGAFCAISAAAFALLGAVVADRSAAAMQDRAAEVDAADEVELRAVAMDEDERPAASMSLEWCGRAPIDAAGPDDDDRDEDERPEVDEVGSEARAGVDELAAWLADREPPEQGAPSVRPAPPDDDPAGEARDAEDDAFGSIWDWTPPAPRGGHIVGRDGGGHIDARPDDEAGHIDHDQHAVPERGEPDEGARRVQAAADARRAAGDRTREMVRRFLRTRPDATVPQIAAALDISEATAKRHRRALRSDREVEL